MSHPIQPGLVVFAREFQGRNMPHTEKTDSFEDWSPPEVAANYRRLRRDKRVTEVVKTLRRRGMSDWEIEILYRNIASIPRNWRSDREPTKQAESRRNRLAKKLRVLAKEIVSDPDLRGLGFEIGGVVYANSHEHLDDAHSLAQILETAISLLEPGDTPLIRMADGKTLTPREFERRFRPARSVPLKSYVLREVFRLLNPSSERNGKIERRALNRETEILASVLLRKDIRSGTMTQLRKKDRRRYGRDQ